MISTDPTKNRCHYEVCAIVWVSERYHFYRLQITNSQFSHKNKTKIEPLDFRMAKTHYADVFSHPTLRTAMTKRNKTWRTEEQELKMTTPFGMLMQKMNKQFRELTPQEQGIVALKSYVFALTCNAATILGQVTLSLFSCWQFINAKYENVFCAK
jgi:hypothetical protein